jgi:hypothetical protein
MYVCPFAPTVWKQRACSAGSRPASSAFLSHQFSTSHQPPASQPAVFFSHNKLPATSHPNEAKELERCNPSSCICVSKTSGKVAAVDFSENEMDMDRDRKWWAYVLPPIRTHGGILKRERYLHHPYSFLKIPWIIRDFIYVCILRSQAQLFISLRIKEGIVPYFQVLFLLKELRRSMNLASAR